MQPTVVRDLLYQAIADLSRQPQVFAVRPGKDFTRDRKITVTDLICMLLTLCGKTIDQELCGYFGVHKDVPFTDAAFCAARAKLRSEALNVLLSNYAAILVNMLHHNCSDLLLFACDGSDLYFGLNENDVKSLIQMLGANPSTSFISTPYTT